jgi:Fe-S-cluster containining protein
MEFKECKSCPGWCCVRNDLLFTPLTAEDIERIAAYFNIPLDKFIASFVVLNKGRRTRHYRSAPDAVGHLKYSGPCHFLRQGLCGINSVKPKACREMKPRRLKGITCAEWSRMQVGL